MRLLRLWSWDTERATDLRYMYKTVKAAIVFLHQGIFYLLISGIFPIYRIYTNQKAVIGTLLFQKFSRTLHSGNK